MKKVGKEGLKQIRSQVVRLKKMGKSGKEIEEIAGVRQNRISEIWTAYQREGEASFQRKKYGRKPGTHMLLEAWEQAEIRDAVVEKSGYQGNSGRWGERGNTSGNTTAKT